MVVTQREFQHAIAQINQAFEQVNAKLAKLEQLVESKDEEKPKVGRPKKEAA